MDGFAAIDALGNARLLKQTAYRTAMGGVAALPRNQALDGTGATAADNLIMDAWFALTAAGTGPINDGNLTAANARAL